MTKKEKQICFKCHREIKLNSKVYSGYDHGEQWFCCPPCLRKQEQGIF